MSTHEQQTDPAPAPATVDPFAQRVQLEDEEQATTALLATVLQRRRQIAEARAAIDAADARARAEAQAQETERLRLERVAEEAERAAAVADGVRLQKEMTAREIARDAAEVVGPLNDAGAAVLDALRVLACQIPALFRATESWEVIQRRVAQLRRDGGDATLPDVTLAPHECQRQMLEWARVYAERFVESLGLPSTTTFPNGVVK